MALATFSDLKTTAADFLNRSDLTSVLPTFILLTEAKVRRVLRGAVARATVTVSGYETALPSDFQEAVSLYHAGPTYYFPIELLTTSNLSAKRGLIPESGVPTYGAILNRSLLLTPTPTTSYDLSLDYYADLDALSDDNPTNWVLTDHPDVYLYGVLAEAEPYLKNDERVMLWREQFENGIAQIRVKYERQHFGANSPALRPLRAIG